MLVVKGLVAPGTTLHGPFTLAELINENTGLFQVRVQLPLDML